MNIPSMDEIAKLGEQFVNSDNPMMKPIQDKLDEKKDKIKMHLLIFAFLIVGIAVGYYGAERITSAECNSFWTHQMNDSCPQYFQTHTDFMTSKVLNSSQNLSSIAGVVKTNSSHAP